MAPKFGLVMMCMVGATALMASTFSPMGAAEVAEGKNNGEKKGVFFPEMPYEYSSWRTALTKIMLPRASEEEHCCLPAGSPCYGPVPCCSRTCTRPGFPLARCIGGEPPSKDCCLPAGAPCADSVPCCSGKCNNAVYPFPQCVGG